MYACKIINYFSRIERFYHVLKKVPPKRKSSCENKILNFRVNTCKKKRKLSEYTPIVHRPLTMHFSNHLSNAKMFEVRRNQDRLERKPLSWPKEKRAVMYR